MRGALRLVAAMGAAIAVTGLLSTAVATDPFDGCGGVHTQARRAHKTTGASTVPADCLVPACQTIGTHASIKSCTTLLGQLICSEYSGAILVDTIGVTTACPDFINALTWQ